MKELIINQTLKLLDTMGLKFTIDDISNNLNISKKTIYRYFNNKESLVKAVYKQKNFWLYTAHSFYVT